jgi:tetratricopeptide (TPR) repeat protein
VKRAQELQGKGDLNGALLEFNIADSIQPSFMSIIHNRGLVKFSLGDYAGAIDDMDRSIDLCVDKEQCETYHGNRALVHMQAGQMDLACADWNLAGSRGRSYLKEHCK